MPAVLVSVALRRLARLLGRHDGEAPQTALFALPGPLNRLLIRLLGAEAWLMRYVSLPLGASLVVVARKPEHEPSPAT